MAFNYPYGDTQQLNLNWFLAQWETFREQWATAEEGIDHALDAEIARVEAAMTDLYAARDAAAASKTAAQTAATNAASSETVATQQATLAQSYANTAQTQAGIATAAAEAAGNSASSASNSASNANLSKVQAGNSATAAGQSATLANDKATAAGLSAAQAGVSATNAAGSAEDSEAWAVGERGGSPVASGDDTYENNSKYYADQAATVAASIPADYTELSDDVSELKTAITQVESDIYTVSDNLFDFDNIVSNKAPASVGSGADDFASLNGWNTSNYIPVTAGKQYALILNGNITTGAVFRVACYKDGIMTYKTSSGNESNPYTVPSNVDHIRFYSNTANLFNGRTNTSFKEYSSDMSKAWTPYGNQENFLVKGALPEYGVYVDGTNYYHFVNFGEKTLIRLFKREGPNNLFQYSATYVGEVSRYGVSINETIATNGTDTVGPISIMRQGVDSGGMFSGGWHTKTVEGVAYPTAEQQSLDVKVNGESIVGHDGLYYGECIASVVNKLYFPQTITGADLSTATQAIEEHVDYILNDKMTTRVSHKYVSDVRVILYYGMQCVRIGFTKVLLPDNETKLTFSDLTANYLLEKPELFIGVENDDWHYDLTLQKFGLANFSHNPGTGTTKYGYIGNSVRKIYWVLIEGSADYSFIPSGKILSWEGVYNIYPK